MSAWELSKFTGAILIVALVLIVIGVIGNALVAPKKEGVPAAAIATAPAERAPEPATAAPAKPIAELLAGADAAKGGKVFGKCKACHTAAKDGKNGIGPNLWNVLGANLAHRDDFSYSAAMKNKGGAWTYQSLDAFLTKPKDAVPGTKMTFAGISKAEERADLIAYLRTLSDSPPPLP